MILQRLKNKCLEWFKSGKPAGQPTRNELQSNGDLRTYYSDGTVRTIMKDGKGEYFSLTEASLKKLKTAQWKLQWRIRFKSLISFFRV